MRASASHHDERWQREADLLAEGRDFIERACARLGYRHLYPEGPNLALLLEGYQELERRRVLERAPTSYRAQLRLFRRLLRRALRRDARGRNLRLVWQVPLPRLTPRALLLPPLVERALGRVDPDARPLVRAELRGRSSDLSDAASDLSMIAARHDRGLEQFRGEFLNEALAHPHEIAALHEQLLGWLASPPPRRRERPIARLVFVKLPMVLWMSTLTLLVGLYFAAFAFFNGPVLGRFLTANIGTLLDGELEFESVTWRPRLIVDLVTGTPSPVLVENTTVWEPFKRYGGDKRRWAAQAPRLEVELVLHEIIPWNDLGVPPVFEIPWVLHFTKVRSRDPLWLDVRGYEDVRSNGEKVQLIGLLDAFSLLDDSPTQGSPLRYAVENVELPDLRLGLDFAELQNWSTRLWFDRVELDLAHDTPYPGQATAELPFHFEVSGHVSSGNVNVAGVELRAHDVDVSHFRCGRGDAPLSTVRYALTGEIGGSPISVTGAFLDAFTRHARETRSPVSADPSSSAVSLPPDAVGLEVFARTEAPAGIVADVSAQLGLAEGTLEASGAVVEARVSGTVSDPSYELRGERLSVDALDEPAWVADDARFVVQLHEEPVPARAEASYASGEPRFVARFSALEASLMDGVVRLADASAPAEVILPDPGTKEPYVLAGRFALSGVNPSHLLVDGGDVADRLAGTASGVIDLEQLILRETEVSDDSNPIESVSLRFEKIELRRDRGPASDGLPTHLRLDGPVRQDAQGALSTGGLSLGTDGGKVVVAGGIDAKLESLRPTDLTVDVTDGPAFFAAFGMESLFSKLQAHVQVSGPVFAPSGPWGTLEIEGLGGSTLAFSPTTTAQVAFHEGNLAVRSPAARLLGGQGSLSLEVALFERGQIASDPKVLAAVDLSGVSTEPILGTWAKGSADVRLAVDDGHGRPVPWSKVTARGSAYLPTLAAGGTTYTDATASFVVHPDRVELDGLRLPLHQHISPHHAARVSVPVGELRGRGTVGFGSDPTLDLVLGAQGMPLSFLGRLLELDLPVHGRIDEGTELMVQGTFMRPLVRGRLELSGTRIDAIPTGRGAVDFTSRDVPRSGRVAPHREIVAKARFGRASREADDLVWSAEAVLAIAERVPGKTPAVATTLTADIDHVAIPTLVKATHDPRLGGYLQGTRADVRSCPRGEPLLAACESVPAERAEGPTSASDGLQIRIGVERAVVGPSDFAFRDPTRDCASDVVLCTKSKVTAEVAWPSLHFDAPIVLQANHGKIAELEGSGTLRLAADTSAPLATQDCTELDPLAVVAHDASTPGARIRGTVALQPFASLFEEFGIVDLEGQPLRVDLGVSGPLFDPQITGRVEAGAPNQAGPTSAARTAWLRATYAPLRLPVGLLSLDLQLRGGVMQIEGEFDVAGQRLRIGPIRRVPAWIGVSGPCRGRFQLAASGAIGAEVVQAVLGDDFVRAKGAIDLDELFLRGDLDTSVPPQISGLLSFGKNALGLDFAESRESLELRSGTLHFGTCSPELPCPAPDGSILLAFGGLSAHPSDLTPTAALSARVGERGAAALWGRAYLTPDLKDLVASALAAQLEDVPYATDDARGRRQLELELSSPRIVIEGTYPILVSGALEVDRARWVGDAIEGVEILKWIDDVDLPSPPPPEIVRKLRFDLQATTSTPLRVDNNIARGVEARMNLAVRGSYEEPEVTGQIDVEPGGTVHISLLTGTYEIERGRVVLSPTSEDSPVDVLARRREPVFIEGQPRQVHLVLGGTLDSIVPRCYTAGDSKRSSESSRDCFDYLVFGAGDVNMTTADVRRSGGAQLSAARRPLEVVGNMTQLDVGKAVRASLGRAGGFVPDAKLGLGQIGVEMGVSTPESWADFGWGHARFGFDYMRGYPQSFLRQRRELTLRLDVLGPARLELRRTKQSYLNQRVVFDPLEQSALEFRLDFDVPTLR